MSGFAHIVRDFLFGPNPSEPPSQDKQLWRDAIHEHRNVAQVSVAAAKASMKKSIDAIKVAECAIQKLEKTHEKGDGQS